MKYQCVRKREAKIQGTKNVRKGDNRNVTGTIIFYLFYDK